MKEISELNFPADLRYDQDHEWVRPEGDHLRCGISDYAQDQLGDIVFVELPQRGDKFEMGQEFGTVESVKAVSELYMPLTGEIVSVNGELEDNPGIVNSAPYQEGWMIEIKPDNPGDVDSLLTMVDYLEMLKGIE
jgi:glycine cleavage system H protein